MVPLSMGIDVDFLPHLLFDRRQRMTYWTAAKVISESGITDFLFTNALGYIDRHLAKKAICDMMPLSA